MATRRELAHWLFQHTRPLLWPLIVSTLSRILGDLLNVVVLIGIGGGIVLAMQGDTGILWPLAVFTIVLSLFKAGFRYLEHYSGHWVAFAALQRLRELLFRRLIPQAPAATTGKASADLTARATEDIDRIEVFFAHTIPPVIAAVVVPGIALGAFAAIVSPSVALFIAVPLAAALLLPFLGARRTAVASRDELAARGDLSVHITDDAQGLREILAFDARTLRDHGRRRHEARVRAARQRTASASAVREIIERLLWGAALVLVVAFGGDTQTVLLGITLLLGLWLGGAGTDDFASGLDAALTACDRVRRVVEAAPAVLDRGTRDLAGTGPLAVQLDGATFSYPGGGSRVLQGVDLQVGAGDWLRVAGVSGSGKSTIAGLLIRAHDVDEGEVRLGGVPITDVPLSVLRRVAAVVDQRPVLFAGTVADNLRLARPDGTDAELRDALRIAALDGDALPDGTRTRVGERGSALSGGQVQRIALARALVARPRVLVMDESLSQLDEATADTVRQRLGTMANRPTVIEITHRVDVLPDDAQVIVIDRGLVVERGFASALRASGGAFTRLGERV